MSLRQEKPQPNPEVTNDPVVEATLAAQVAATVENQEQEFLVELEATIQELLETGIQNPEDRKLLRDCIHTELQLVSAQFQKSIEQLGAYIPISEEISGALWRITTTHFIQREGIEAVIEGLCDGQAFFVEYEGRVVPARLFSLPPGIDNKGQQRNAFCAFRPKSNPSTPNTVIGNSSAGKLFINPKAIFPLIALGRILQAQEKGYTTTTGKKYEIRFGVPTPTSVTFVKELFSDPLKKLLALQKLQGGFKPSYKDDEPGELAEVQPAIFRLKPEFFDKALVPMVTRPLVEETAVIEPGIAQVVAEVTRVLLELLKTPKSFVLFNRKYPTSFLRIQVPRGTKRTVTLNAQVMETAKFDIETALAKLQKDNAGSAVSIPASFFGLLIQELEQKTTQWKNDIRNSHTYEPKDGIKPAVYLGGTDTLLTISFRDSSTIPQQS